MEGVGGRDNVMLGAAFAAISGAVKRSDTLFNVALDDLETGKEPPPAEDDGAGDIIFCPADSASLLLCDTPSEPHLRPDSAVSLGWGVPHPPPMELFLSFDEMLDEVALGVIEMNPTGSLDFGEIVWNWATRGLMFNGMDSNRQFEYALVHQWSDMVGLAECHEQAHIGTFAPQVVVSTPRLSEERGPADVDVLYKLNANFISMVLDALRDRIHARLRAAAAAVVVVSPQ